MITTCKSFSLLKNLKQGIIEDISIVTDNKKMGDNATDNESKPMFNYKKLNPMENYYTLSVDENETEMTNPFKDIEDSVAFAKKLRT